MMENQNLDSARKAAYLALRDVEENKAYAGLAVKSVVKNLSPQNASFARELVYGTIRKQMFFDYLIGSFIRTPVNKLPVSDKVLLRMGLSQLLTLGSVPEYAAVSETVELAKRYSRGREKFINGVLRTYIREKDSVELPDRDKDIVKYLSLKYSFAPWIVEMWLKSYEESDFVEHLLDALNKNPRFCIRVNTLKTTPEELIKEFELLGYSVTQDEDLADVLFLDEMSEVKPLDTEFYKKGLFSVQDKSSRLTAFCLDARPGDLIIDVCSAPGGKTMAIAETMNNTGRIVAMDIHEHKAGLIESEAKRLGIKIVETLTWDSTKTYNEFIGAADRVLVDAPCSGLGTARRKPDVKYKPFDERMETLPQTQLEILRASAHYLKQGGILVYSTCTIAARENKDVVTEFLSSEDEFELVDMIQLMPMTGETDGFFMCKLKRRENAFGGNDAE